MRLDHRSSHLALLHQDRLCNQVGGTAIPYRHEVQARHRVLYRQDAEPRAVRVRGLEEVHLKNVTTPP